MEGQREGKMVRVCCYCKKVQAENGSWVEKQLEDKLEATHGICTPCYERQKRLYSVEKPTRNKAIA